MRPIHERVSARIGVQLEKATVQAAGVRTNYYCAGAGEPVVLIHGASATGLTWWPVIAPLAARYRVIAPDTPGFGKSQRLEARFTWPVFTTWLASFMDALGLGAVRLIGHSLGGAVVLHFTLDHPERVSRLVLVDALGLGMGSRLATNLLGMSLLTPMNPITGSIVAPLAIHDLRKMGRLLFGATLSQVEVGRRTLWHMAQGDVDQLGGQVPAEQLGQIRAPTLLMWGEKDRILPAYRARAAQPVIPGAELIVFPHAGHLPYMEQPGEFNRALLEFLSR
jgi:pimeloyl-ACP methyl ester carboxylesterase